MNNQIDDLDPLGMNDSLLRLTEYYGKNFHSWSELFEDACSSVDRVAKNELDKFEKKKKESGESSAEDRWFDYAKCHAKIAEKSHLIYLNFFNEIIDIAFKKDDASRQKTKFAAEHWFQTFSPKNLLWTNPIALEKFRKSKGKSSLSAMNNIFRDLSAGKKLIPELTPSSEFVIGEDIAKTRGKIVFKNELVELIQYSPQTSKVYEIPVVFFPPWVGKYYLLDLRPGESLVEFLVQSGFTVFMTSWKNPAPYTDSFCFEDYVSRGIDQVVEKVSSLTNVANVHAVGHCAGGTTLSAYMGSINRENSKSKKEKIGHWTLLSSLVDFSNPGVLGNYANENFIKTLFKKIDRDGCLTSEAINLAFRLVRPAQLIWPQFTKHYVFGEEIPVNPVLHWSRDTPRISSSLAKFSLKDLYFENRLIKENDLFFEKIGVDLKQITQPAYVVGNELDHLTPWKETYKIGQLVSAKIRYCLGSDGHINGILTSPTSNSGSSYFSGDVCKNESPIKWKKNQKEKQGSWWLDWRDWLIENCGKRIDAAQFESDLAGLDDAPGSYVREIEE